MLKPSLANQTTTQTYAPIGHAGSATSVGRGATPPHYLSYLKLACIDDLFENTDNGALHEPDDQQCTSSAAIQLGDDVVARDSTMPNTSNLDRPHYLSFLKLNSIDELFADTDDVVVAADSVHKSTISQPISVVGAVGGSGCSVIEKSDSNRDHYLSYLKLDSIDDLFRDSASDSCQINKE